MYAVFYGHSEVKEVLSCLVWDGMWHREGASVLQPEIVRYP